MFNQIRNFFIAPRVSRGLTLIEVLVTASLIVFISTMMIRNIALSKLNLERIANVVASDVRLAQSLALSTKQTEGQIRCGYGITKANSTGSESSIAQCSDGIDNDGDLLVDSVDPGCNRVYYIYAGPPTTGSCASKFYQTPQDTPTYKTVVLDSRVEFKSTPAFSDIFYEPPDPKVYLQGSSTVEDIVIKKVGTANNACNNLSPNCIHVCVYNSGRVEVTRGPNCP